jgi:hypothetical protein
MDKYDRRTLVNLVTAVISVFGAGLLSLTIVLAGNFAVVFGSNNNFHQTYNYREPSPEPTPSVVESPDNQTDDSDCGCPEDEDSSDASE